MIAISTNDAAMAEYVRRALPGGDEMLLSVAATHAHPALAHAVEARLVELDKAWPGKIGAIAIVQSNPSLSRKMYELRDQLLPKTAMYVPHALEHAYDAQLGAELEDWDTWLEKHPTAGAK